MHLECSCFCSHYSRHKMTVERHNEARLYPLVGDVGDLLDMRCESGILCVCNDEIMVGESNDFHGNVMYCPRLCLCDGLIMEMIKTYKWARPTSNMNQGFLCRNLL